MDRQTTRGSYHGQDTWLELTGRKRRYHRKRGSMAGARSSEFTREYRCSCGHVGWSNHMDLERLEEELAKCSPRKTL